MTMEHPEQHPDDERLAALADMRTSGSDDASLRSHVTGCARCAELVDDLRSLRVALAELPDLAPARPMRLLPPVEQRRAGWVATFARRLFVPALVGGLALGVVGGAGSLSTLGGMMGASGAAPALREVGAAGGRPSGAEGDGKTFDSSSQGGAVATERPAAQSFDALRAAGESGPPPIIWPLLLVAGLVLIGVALLLRFVVQPGAA